MGPLSCDKNQEACAATCTSNQGGGEQKRALPLTSPSHQHKALRCGDLCFLWIREIHSKENLPSGEEEGVRRRKVEHLSEVADPAAPKAMLTEHTWYLTKQNMPFK